MNIRNAYDLWSGTYDSDNNLTRDLDARVTENALKNESYNTILEIGCGTGKNTLLFSRIGDIVHAIDFSAGMMANARATIDSDNVIFTRADITEPWPVKSGTADLVVCNLVLEHTADLHFIFGEAARSLRKNGHFYISELHPFRQYQGKKANFQQEDKLIEISSHVHHISDFIESAHTIGFSLSRMDEWWHEKDQGSPPRLVTFRFVSSSRN